MKVYSNPPFHLTNSKKTKFDIAYSKSYGFFSDFFEAAKQKVRVDNVVTSFFRWLGGAEIMPDVIQEEFKNLAIRFNSSQTIGVEDLQNHLNQYMLNYAEGRITVTVSHSQGVFYANNAFEILYKLGFHFPFYNLMTQNSFGIVAVAPPASFVAGNGPHTTLYEDQIIRAVSLSVFAGIPLPLGANMHKDQNIETNDNLIHRFNETYAVAGSTHAKKINDDIINMMPSLMIPQTGIVNIEFTSSPGSSAPYILEPNGGQVKRGNEIGVSGYLTKGVSETYSIPCKTLEAGIYKIEVDYSSINQLQTSQISVSVGTRQSNFSYSVPFVQEAGTNKMFALNLVATGDKRDGFDLKIQLAENAQVLPSGFEELVAMSPVPVVLPSPPPSEPNKIWTIQFGSNLADYANGMAIDANGNLYVAGYTSGNLDGANNIGAHDSFLTKFNTNGTKLWTKQFGSSGDDYAFSVALDALGNSYVVGWTFGNLDGKINTGWPNSFVIKFDTNGNQQWTRQFGHDGASAYAVDIALDIAGNLYIAGRTSGNLDGNINTGSYDGFVIKFDTNGIKQWTRQYGSIALDYTYNIAVDPLGNSYVVGYTSDSLDGNISAGRGDGFVIKFNNNGDKLWVRQFGSSADETAHSVAVDVNGNSYVVGSTSGSLDGNTHVEGYAGFIMKFNIDGNQQWVKQFNSNAGSPAYGVALDMIGNSYVVSEINFGLSFNRSSNLSDGLVMKFNTNGSQQWITQFGSNAAEYPKGIVLDINGNSYVVGSTYSGLDGNNNAGDLDGFVVKFDANGVKQ